MVNHVNNVTLPSRQIQNAASEQVFQEVSPQIFHQTEYNNITMMMMLQELLPFPA
jgi:hypothetical protein